MSPTDFLIVLFDYYIVTLFTNIYISVNCLKHLTLMHNILRQLAYCIVQITGLVQRTILTVNGPKLASLFDLICCIVAD